MSTRLFTPQPEAVQSRRDDLSAGLEEQATHTPRQAISGMQVFEFCETSEVPEVKKTSRVVQEVRVHREAFIHEATVKSALLHTELDMQTIDVGSIPQK